MHGYLQKCAVALAAVFVFCAPFIFFLNVEAGGINITREVTLGDVGYIKVPREFAFSPALSSCTPVAFDRLLEEVDYYASPNGIMQFFLFTNAEYEQVIVSETPVSDAYQEHALQIDGQKVTANVSAWGPGQYIVQINIRASRRAVLSCSYSGDAAVNEMVRDKAPLEEIVTTVLRKTGMHLSGRQND